MELTECNKHRKDDRRPKRDVGKQDFDFVHKRARAREEIVGGEVRVNHNPQEHHERRSNDDDPCNECPAGYKGG